MRELLRDILAIGRANADLVVATVTRVEGTEDVVAGQKLLILGSGEGRGPLLSSRLGERIRTDGFRCLLERRSRVIRYDWPADAAHPSGWLEVYYDVLPAPPHLVICGAGHIALPLAGLAKTVGFQVTVIDDRPEYANRDRFPEAQAVMALPFVEALRGLPVNTGTYIAIITRGHSYDAVCLRQVIHSPAAYIGMIGSRRRVWAVLSAMRDEGYPVEKLERVHAPIGLPIAADTPEEIALSVLAEMVSVSRQGDSWSLAFKQGKHLELLRSGIGERRTADGGRGPNVGESSELP